MTDPASPAAVTEERAISELELKSVLARLRDPRDQMSTSPTPAFDDYCANIIERLASALDARGLELARLRERGLRAVLETHVKPLLRDAFSTGVSYSPDCFTVKAAHELAEAYAKSVIASLTQDPARDV